MTVDVNVHLGHWPFRRHGYEDTPRNRILMVSGNVWLHLHPSKVRKHATSQTGHTWQ